MSANPTRSTMTLRSAAVPPITADRLARRLRLAREQVWDHMDKHPRIATLGEILTSVEGVIHNLAELERVPASRSAAIRTGWCLGRLHALALQLGATTRHRILKDWARGLALNARESLDLLQQLDPNADPIPAEES